MATCANHPDATIVPLPGDPGVMVCSRCPTVVSGTPQSWNRAGRTLRRNTPPSGSGCLSALLVVAGTLAALGRGARAAHAATDNGVLDHLSWVDGRHIIGLALAATALAAWAVFRHGGRRRDAGDRIAAKHYGVEGQADNDPYGGECRTKFIDDVPVVEQADERIRISGELLNLARDGKLPGTDYRRTRHGTVIVFGTDGHGLGRVVYRVGELAYGYRNTYCAERIV